MADMSDELIDSWKPAAIYETPSEARARNPSFGLPAQQCSAIIRAIRAGARTNAQILAACEYAPELDLSAARVSDRLRGMALNGAVVPYMQPYKVRFRTHMRYVWALEGEDAPDGSISLDDANKRCESTDFQRFVK